MRDKDYIKMKREEGREEVEKWKPVYKLRGEDFIPIVGLRNFWKREASERNSLTDLNPPYLDKCFNSEAIITLYNIAIVCGAGYGIERLVHLLSK